ncbi:Holliday junction branch migration protein RuvA [uncultured Actinomyces sp.]|jgi:holliday junction DNA helicase ruvA|uniref:Holliday junction branch migration protein RuvA n=2 Tax=Actinomyces TaxID=1654 RepID=UPI001CB45118|nr:Holliday junction branch migration protein RuvA [uncultured Actinomyces sp.]MBF0949382.1 Holliday junction branch migration protein RuvA [Actinomyces sp.]
MISRVLGTVAQVGVDDVVVVYGGLGFKVFIVPPLASELHKGDEIELYTHLIVREDALTLYGFKTEEERKVFEILMSVTGIGPRIGLAALSVFSPNDLRRAVADQDTATLSRIPGVGKKVASRMLVELGDKLGLPAQLPEASAPSAGVVEAEVKAALIGLGWNETKAESVLSELGGNGLNASDLLRAALMKLGGANGR